MMQCTCNTQKADQTGVIYLHLVCLPCTLCMDWDWTQTPLFHKWCNTHGTHRKLTRLPEPARTNRASGHNDHRDNQLSQVLHLHLLLLLGAAEKITILIILQLSWRVCVFPCRQPLGLLLMRRWMWDFEHAQQSLKNWQESLHPV